MQFTKIPFLLGIFGVTLLTSNLTAQAQTQAKAPQNNVPRTLTVVDIYGNVVRNTGANQFPGPSNGGVNNSATSDRYQRGDGRNDYRGNGRNDGRGGNWNNGRGGNYGNNYGGNNYYVPASPYYPYGVQTYSYYPQVPTTALVTPQVFGWQQSGVISGLPYGSVYNAYPSSGYGYGYPLPTYGNTYSPYTGVPYSGVPYTGVPYPIYGSTTYINGAGGIYTQSQSSGYGISIGRGGVSAHLGNSRNSSSTTVRGR